MWLALYAFTIYCVCGDLAIDPVCIPSEKFSWWKRHWREVVLYSVMGALIALSFLIPGAPAGACLLVKILVGVVTAAVSCFLISAASTVLAGILYGADMSNLWADAGWAALWGAVGALVMFGVFATVGAIARKVRAVNAARATAAARARGAANTSVAKAVEVDFYVTPQGDAIPMNKVEFNRNLSYLENRGGKYVGQSSNGNQMRIRIESPHTSINPAAPQNQFHDVSHIHIEYRKNGLTGGWGEGIGNNFPFPLSWFK